MTQKDDSGGYRKWAKWCLFGIVVLTPLLIGVVLLPDYRIPLGLPPSVAYLYGYLAGVGAICLAFNFVLPE